MNMITIKVILATCQHMNPQKKTKSKNMVVVIQLSQYTKTNLGMKRITKEDCIYCNTINAQHHVNDHKHQISATVIIP